MYWLAIVPFIAQAIVIALDEGIFHLRRGLPLWERIGHPIDTASVLACMLFVLFVPFSITTMKIYIGLALFSTLLVTKDEFIHKQCCPWKEQWLHAILFTLHPITLTMAGFIWPVVQGYEVSPWLATWLSNPHFLYQFLSIQASTMGLFLLYQIIYWNVLWDSKNA